MSEASAADLQSNPTKEKESGHAWVSLIGYVAVHLGCLGVIWLGFSWKGLAILLGTYFVRVFGIGAAYHRYFSHRAFKTSRPMQLFLAFVGTLGLQKGCLWWAQTHRYHHRHADTPEDLHSPKYQGFNHSHWGWFFENRHRETDLEAMKDFASFPELVVMDHPATTLAITVGYATLMYVLWGWTGVVWGFCMSGVWVLHISHWIQSFSHAWGGYRRCPTDDYSRNHFLLGIISMGEWHNNHHYAPSSARQGFVWWEIDVCYYLIKLMSWAGLVWDLKIPPKVIEATSGVGQIGQIGTITDNEVETARVASARD